MKEDITLLEQFPKDPPAPYNEGLGQLEPLEEPVYGKRRIVGRVSTDLAENKPEAVKIAKQRGYVYEDCYATARFWCFVVYE